MEPDCNTFSQYGQNYSVTIPMRSYKLLGLEAIIKILNHWVDVYNRDVDFAVADISNLLEFEDKIYPIHVIHVLCVSRRRCSYYFLRVWALATTIRSHERLHGRKRRWIGKASTSYYSRFAIRWATVFWWKRRTTYPRNCLSSRYRPLVINTFNIVFIINNTIFLAVLRIDTFRHGFNGERSPPPRKLCFYLGKNT